MSRRPRPISSGWIVFWIFAFWPLALVVVAAQRRRDAEIALWDVKEKRP